MKIVSINHVETTGPECIAFNLDQVMTPEILSNLEYGDLTFRAEGKVLWVSIADKDPFTQENVQNLNEYLKDAAEAVDRIYQKRLRMLKMISETCGVPLDKS